MARRAFRPAAINHDPVVEVEGAAPKRRRGRLTVGSIVRFAGAFAVTMALLGLAYHWFMADRARYAPPALARETLQAGPMAVAVELLGRVRASQEAYSDGWRLPGPARADRERAFQAGMVDAVAAYAEALALGRAYAGGGESAGSVSELRNMAGLGQEAAVPARLAAAERLLSEDKTAVSSSDLSLMLTGMANRAVFHQGQLRIAMAEHEAWYGAGPAAEAAFFEAKGEFFAWGLLLEAALGKARPELQLAAAINQARVRAGAAAVARYAPVILRDGPPNDAYAANHLAVQIANLALLDDEAGKAAIRLPPDQAFAPAPRRPRRR